jgi:hypothetical protein
MAHPVRAPVGALVRVIVACSGSARMSHRSETSFCGSGNRDSLAGSLDDGTRTPDVACRHDVVQRARDPGTSAKAVAISRCHGSGRRPTSGTGTLGRHIGTSVATAAPGRADRRAARVIAHPRRSAVGPDATETAIGESSSRAAETRPLDHRLPPDDQPLPGGGPVVSGS